MDGAITALIALLERIVMSAQSKIKSVQATLSKAQRKMEKNQNADKELGTAAGELSWAKEDAYFGKREIEKLSKERAKAMMKLAYNDMVQAEQKALKTKNKKEMEASKRLMELANIKIEIASVWNLEETNSLAEDYAKKAKAEAEKLHKDASRSRFGKKKEQSDKSGTKLATAKFWAKDTSIEKGIEELASRVTEQLLQWGTYHIIDGAISACVEIIGAPGARPGAKAAKSGIQFGIKKVRDRYPSTTDPGVACGICHQCQTRRGDCLNTRNA
jgi:hypothetical protein